MQQMNSVNLRRTAEQDFTGRKELKGRIFKTANNIAIRQRAIC